jgi:4-diphosphocytidyl-2-C-methyl-D-erythritol kinase
LGADVPACVLGTSLHMTGTGEAIREIPPLPRLGIVVVNPLIPCLTGPVYRQYDQRARFACMTQATLPDMSTTARLLDYLRATPNDLEPPAIALVPEIGEVLAAISNSPEVLLARMSGSGATCFGLYSDARAAQGAAHHIKKALASFPIWVEADVVR